AAWGGGGGGGDGGGAPALTVNAGADQTVDPGQTVTLRALSSDPAATISWSIYSGQTLPLVDNGAEVTFESPDVICPTGIRLEAVATLGAARATDSVVVTTLPFTGAIGPDAGEDQRAIELNQVTLTTKYSIEPCNVQDVEWQQVSGPTGQVVYPSPNGGDIAVANVPDVAEPAAIEYQLVVTDVRGKSASDRVQVVVNPIDAVPLQSPIPNGGSAITSLGPRLFVGSLDAAYEVDPASGDVRSVAGNGLTGDNVDAFYLSDLDGLSGLSPAGDELIAVSGSGRIFGLDPDASGTGIARVVEQLGCCNYFEFSFSQGRLYTKLDSTVYLSPETTGEVATPLFSGGPTDGHLLADDRYVYLTSKPDSCDREFLDAYDPNSGQVTRIGDVPLAFPSCDPGGFSAQTADTLYWLAGSRIYQLDKDTLQYVLLADLGSPATRLVAASNALYARMQFAGESAELLRITLPAGSIESLGQIEALADIAVAGDQLYWATHPPNSRDGVLFRMLPDDSGEIVATVPEALLSDQGGLGDSLISAGDKMVMSGDGVLAIVDPDDGSFAKVRPVTGATVMRAKGNELLVASRTGNEGIGAIRTDLPVQQPREIYRFEPGGISSFDVDVDGDWIYFVEDELGSGSRVRRVGIESLVAETLFSGELLDLRDVHVDSDRLFFLCHTSCGLQEPSLVTMPATGGQPEFVFSPGPVQVLNGDYANGFAVLSYRNEGALGLGFAEIDLATLEFSPQLEVLPFDEARVVGGGGNFVIGGLPGSVVRAPVEGNGDPTDPQVVSRNGVRPSSGLRLDSIHADDVAMYFWWNGLWRVLN
ncbi:MAG: hypothetical protein WBO15_04780, partial [Gammaproteobacteria bacterium]